MEWIWRPNSESLGNDTQIFTHVLYNHYSSPDNLDFDVIDNNMHAWINDESSEDYSAPDLAKVLIPQLEDRAKHYLTTDIMLLFGGDFEYMNAAYNYQQMDRMIEYMNKHHGDRYNFRYSTPSDYVDAVSRHQIKWPTKYDDMFPYSDNPDSYWTGYFTSRANDKEQIRRGSSNFHASSQLYSQSVL